MILVVATGNAGKVRELRALLAGLPVELRSLRDHPGAPEAVEDGDTFLANARLKARAVAGHTGLPALADDSGLEVDALDGRPGVRSARFAADASAGSGDAANVDLLLARLLGVPAERRTARFRCALVVALPDGREISAEGACEGTIAERPRGHGGFGYDPVFLCGARTFAEMPGAEKAAVSHRAVAMAALRPRLVEFLAR